MQKRFLPEFEIEVAQRSNATGLENNSTDSAVEALNPAIGDAMIAPGNDALHVTFDSLGKSYQGRDPIRIGTDL